MSVVPISSFGTNLFLQVSKLPSELLNDETFIVAALTSAALLYAGFTTRMSMISVETKRLTTSSLAHNPTNLLAQNGFSPVDRQSDHHDLGHDLRRGCGDQTKWTTRCSLMPPTPRKLGLWWFAATESKNSTLKPKTRNN